MSFQYVLNFLKVYFRSSNNDDGGFQMRLVCSVETFCDVPNETAAQLPCILQRFFTDVNRFWENHLLVFGIFGFSFLIHGLPPSFVAVCQLRRYDPRRGLASPNHTTNLSVFVLGCIEAYFASHYSCYNICKDLHDLQIVAPLKNQNFADICMFQALYF